MMEADGKRRDIRKKRKEGGYNTIVVLSKYIRRLIDINQSMTTHAY
jgi:hypothetical protein